MLIKGVFVRHTLGYRQLKQNVKKCSLGVLFAALSFYTPYSWLSGDFLCVCPSVCV